MNNHTDSIQAHPDNAGLHFPLKSFFEALKQHGFSVTPLQIINTNRLILHYSGIVKTEAELCPILSPIFASNEEEQVLFKQVFNTHFGRQEHNETNHSRQGPSFEQKLRRHWKDWLLAYCIAIALLILLVIKLTLVYINSAQRVTAFNPRFYIRDKQNGLPPFQVKVNERLELKVERDDSSKLTLLVRYDWGDDSNIDTASYHTYNSPGRYKLVVFIDLLKKAAVIRKYSLSAIVNVYPVLPYTLRKSIQPKVSDHSKPLPGVIDSATMLPATGGLQPGSKFDPILYTIYGGLAVPFFILSILFWILWEREKKKNETMKLTVMERFSKLTDSSMKEKIPVNLPFKNRNYIPVHESEIKEAAKQMRRRVNDHIPFLHVEKTIYKSIDNGGLFQPVHAVRTRQTEWLVLIDETMMNSQLLKLFEYLVEILKKHNVLVDKYYFRKAPAICYHLNDPCEIRLDKLHNKYSKHLLLIFGNGYQLIHPSGTVIDNWYLETLKAWQYKAILTPVSFMDWKEKEINILLPRVPLFPVDMQGLILLTESLVKTANPSDIISRLKQSRAVFYNVADVDFNNIASLEKYCDSAGWAKITVDDQRENILFQWIAALAVYPRVRWELIIGIGKPILEKYGRPLELNFTNLLRIARISWMQQGFMPGPLRLELLKKLTVENEIIARETMLMLLKEIPENDINEKGPAFNEKIIQQVINEFSLYANDPVYYSGYRQSKRLFQKLWQENKIQDPSLSEYLVNDHAAWPTLINRQDDHSFTNVGIEEYFKLTDKEDTALGKLWLCLGAISLFVFICSVFGLIILNRWQWL